MTTDNVGLRRNNILSWENEDLFMEVYSSLKILIVFKEDNNHDTALP